MATKWISKHVHALHTHGVPFKYNLKFWSMDNETFTQDIQQILYVDITFESGCHPKIMSDFTLENIYIFYPIDTPFSPPTIMFEQEFIHPCIVNGQLILDDWCPALSLKQLLCNIYLIYLESLDIVSKNETY